VRDGVLLAPPAATPLKDEPWLGLRLGRLGLLHGLFPLVGVGSVAADGDWETFVPVVASAGGALLGRTFGDGCGVVLGGVCDLGRKFGVMGPGFVDPLLPPPPGPNASATLQGTASG